METTVQPIRCGSVNCYLVKKGRSAILVDTGREAYREKILRLCTADEEMSVRLIVLTHGHVDHVQNAAFLANRLCVPIAMHEEDFPLIADNRRQMLSSKGLLGGIMLFATNRSFRKDSIPPFLADFYLKNGDNLSDYGVDAQVVTLPGHTRGSIGLRVGGSSLLVGDAMMNLPWPRPALVYHNRVALLRSTEKLRSLAPETVYFGHGRPAHFRNGKRG